MTEFQVQAGSNTDPDVHLVNRFNHAFQERLDEGDTGAAIVMQQRDAAFMPDPTDLGLEVEGSWRTYHIESYLGTDADDRLYLLQWQRGPMYLTARALSSHGDADAWAGLAERLEQVQAPKRLPNEQVRVSFWSLTPNGTMNTVRILKVPEWSDAYRVNYAAHVRAQLERLHEFRPGAESTEAGKLILLHGPPGTGKTTAIRSIARSWRTWCDIDYVVDPDEFFGHAYYMTSVLLDNAQPESVKEDGTVVSPRWRLIVVEDADELLTQDAKRRSGQSLSRLLNLCDGLVGQGLRVLVVLTTNEHIAQLHEAVKRPGRCLFDLHLPALSYEDQTDWADLHGVALPPPPHGPAPAPTRTLAELYQLATQSHERAEPPVEYQPGYA